MSEDFSEPYKLDEFGLIDLEYNKRRTIHLMGQEWWDKAMAALDEVKLDKPID